MPIAPNTTPEPATRVLSINCARAEALAHRYFHLSPDTRWLACMAKDVVRVVDVRSGTEAAVLQPSIDASKQRSEAVVVDFGWSRSSSSSSFSAGSDATAAGDGDDGDYSLVALYHTQHHVEGESKQVPRAEYVKWANLRGLLFEGAARTQAQLSAKPFKPTSWNLYPPCYCPMPPPALRMPCSRAISEQHMCTVAMAESRNCVLSGYKDGTVKMWDLSTPPLSESPLQIATEKIRHTEQVQGLACSLARAVAPAPSAPSSPPSLSQLYTHKRLVASVDRAAVMDYSMTKGAGLAYHVLLWDPLLGLPLHKIPAKNPSHLVFIPPANPDSDMQRLVVVDHRELIVYSISPSAAIPPKRTQSFTGFTYKMTISGGSGGINCLSRSQDDRFLLAGEQGTAVLRLYDVLHPHITDPTTDAKSASTTIEHTCSLRLSDIPSFPLDMKQSFVIGAAACKPSTRADDGDKLIVTALVNGVYIVSWRVHHAHMHTHEEVAAGALGGQESSTTTMHVTKLPLGESQPYMFCDILCENGEMKSVLAFSHKLRLLVHIDPHSGEITKELSLKTPELSAGRDPTKYGNDVDVITAKFLRAGSVLVLSVGRVGVQYFDSVSGRLLQQHTGFFSLPTALDAFHEGEAVVCGLHDGTLLLLDELQCAAGGLDVPLEVHAPLPQLTIVSAVSSSAASEHRREAAEALRDSGRSELESIILAEEEARRAQVIRAKAREEFRQSLKNVKKELRTYIELTWMHASNHLGPDELFELLGAFAKHYGADLFTMPAGVQEDWEEMRRSKTKSLLPITDRIVAVDPLTPAEVRLIIAVFDYVSSLPRERKEKLASSFEVMRKTSLPLVPPPAVYVLVVDALLGAGSSAEELPAGAMEVMPKWREKFGDVMNG